MDVSTYFQSRRQGDILSLPSGGDEAPCDHVIVSQSCDVVLAKRSCVLVAPLVELGDPVTRRSAVNRENPQYVRLPGDPAQRFADLERIVSRNKVELVDLPAQPGIDPSDDQAVRDFSLAVARWFGRFAFPDEVQPWLAPLQKQIREKYEQPESPVGRVLHQVAEIRVQAESWTAKPCVLTVHVIVKAGALPTVTDADPPQATSGTAPRAPARIATELLVEHDPGRLTALWDEFAWSLADLCKPRAKHADDSLVTSAVARVDAMLWSDDEFPLSRVRKSEQLDVDFLSEPTPL